VTVRRRFVQLSAATLLVVVPAGAAPMLHEFFEPDPTEDLSLHATTSDGALPALLQTPNGAVRAPSGTRDPSTAKTTYGGAATPKSSDASYRIDRNTTRPASVSYDEPFSPSIAPFKRLYAFDAVNPALELTVFQQGLSSLPVGGELGKGEDAFYADMFVDLVAGAEVRIPSVGSGARVLSANTVPKLAIQLLEDGAENWFVRSKETKRVRLLMQLAVHRSTFGSEFAEVSFEALRVQAPPLPAVARREVALLAAQIGVGGGESPKQVLARLVGYFRGFAPSDQQLQAGSSLELYSELTRLRRGVCRHRAYAFVITALGLGIPARFVRNEAHAWVEVFDLKLWHRIDLGGAAEHLDFNEDKEVGSYTPPADPYLWPEGSSSAQEMLQGGSSGPASTAPNQSPSAPPQAAPPPLLDAPPTLPSNSSALTAQLQFHAALPSNIQRGQPVKLSGKLSGLGTPCANARIDIFLKNADTSTFVGSLATDENGRFQGQAVIPRALSLGDYELLLRSRETESCKSATSD